MLRLVTGALFACIALPVPCPALQHRCLDGRLVSHHCTRPLLVRPFAVSSPRVRIPTRWASRKGSSMTSPRPSLLISGASIDGPALAYALQYYGWRTFNGACALSRRTRPSPSKVARRSVPHEGRTAVPQLYMRHAIPARQTIRVGSLRAGEVPIGCFNPCRPDRSRRSLRNARGRPDRPRPLVVLAVLTAW